MSVLKSNYQRRKIDPSSSERVASTTPSISAQAAIASAEAKLDGKYNGFNTTVEFFAKDNGEVALAHVVQIQNNDHWFETFVDAHTGEILGANDFMSDSTVSSFLRLFFSFCDFKYNYHSSALSPSISKTPALELF